MKSKVIVILGQTAVGKTSLAISLAQKYNGEVISADSRQIYKGMNLGTGKVTEEEAQGIPHHLIDIKNPNDDYSAEEFQRDAFQKIQEIISRGKIPIICGGTGFYIQAIVDNISFQNVPANKKLREELEEKSIEELQNILANIPQEEGVKTDTENKRRLIRAIEIGTYFGKLSCVQAQESEYDFLQIGLKLPQETLEQKIKTRLEDRFKEGMIEEVERLHKEEISWQRLESLGLEYKHIALYLQKEIKTFEELKEILFIKIRQYAKRQMTWFKRDERIVWFSPNQISSIKTLVSEYLQK